MPNVDAAPVGSLDAAGSEAFVVAAFEAHHADVFAFLVRSTRDRFVAEDLLQETYRRLTKEARYGRGPVQVRTWLYRVASNLVVEHPPRRTRALRWFGGFGREEREETIAPVADTGALSGSQATEMERVLEGLSPDARLALLLSGEGFAGDEIAVAIDRSAAATRTLLGLARARVRVRRQLFADDSR